MCRGEGVNLRALLDQLVARSGVHVTVEPDPARFRPAEVPWLVGDPTRIERETRWRPEIGLNQTLGDVLDEWRVRVRLDRRPE